MWLTLFSVCAAKPPTLPRAVTVEDDVPLLSLGPATGSVPSPTGPSDGLRWTLALDTPALGDTTLGAPWQLFDDQGRRTSCRVVAFRRSALDAQGWGSADDPTCGGWYDWAELACAGPVSAGVAIPGRQTAARPVVETAATATDRATADAALARSTGWSSALARVTVSGAAVRTQADVRVFGAWRVVEATAWTGEGWALCGSEDVVERWVFVLDASGRDVLPPRALSDVWDATTRMVDGVYDLDHDGRPELRLRRALTGDVSWGPDGEEQAPLDRPFCGCPC